MSIADETVVYLREHSLVVTTAESCTAGKIVTLLSCLLYTSDAADE